MAENQLADSQECELSGMLKQLHAMTSESLRGFNLNTIERALDGIYKMITSDLDEPERAAYMLYKLERQLRKLTVTLENGFIIQIETLIGHATNTEQHESILQAQGEEQKKKLQSFIDVCMIRFHNCSAEGESVKEESNKLYTILDKANDEYLDKLCKTKKSKETRSFIFKSAAVTSVVTLGVVGATFLLPGTVSTVAAACYVTASVGKIKAASAITGCVSGFAAALFRSSSNISGSYEEHYNKVIKELKKLLKSEEIVSCYSEVLLKQVYSSKNTLVSRYSRSVASEIPIVQNANQFQINVKCSLEELSNSMGNLSCNVRKIKRILKEVRAVYEH